MKIIAIILLLVLLGIVFLFLASSMIISMEISREENELYEHSKERETARGVH